MINPEVEFGLEIIETPFTESDSFGAVKARWTVPAKLRHTEGHFPGNPIVPGYAIIEATAGIFHRLQLINSSNWGVKSAKFMRPLIPGETVFLRVQGQTGTWSLEAESEVETQNVAEIVFVSGQ